jgi:hypothetical protein
LSRGRDRSHVGFNHRGNRQNTCARIRVWLCAHPNGEKRMMKYTLLGAAALVLSSALASPIMARDAPRDHTQKQMRMTPHHMHQRHMAYRHDNMARRNNDMTSREDMAYRTDPNGWNNNWNNNGWNNNYAWNDGRRDSGFWPADVAAGAVGGAIATAGAAVNTAGAIATAPFRGDSYAYYDGANNGWNNYDNSWNRQTYAQRNGFVCEPGTWFKGDDGRPHLCQ